MVHLMPSLASRIGGPLGKAARYAARGREERKDSQVNPSGHVTNLKRGTPYFFKFPEDIQHYPDEQIEEFAARFSDNF